MSESREKGIDRRRTLRIRYSGLKRLGLDDLEKPSIKFAETKDELEQAFALVYQVYSEKKYITDPKEHKLYFSIYSLLPETVHIIAKRYLTVISTLTEIFDTEDFGLPMDVIYKDELDELREKNRNVVELSALATPREYRWKNIFLYQVQVMYWYSLYKGVDDICIAVNPRHVRYYMNLFPFEKLGEEKMYPRVNAPAIGLRGRVEDSIEEMIEIFQALDMETPLDYYFYLMTGSRPIKASSIFRHDLEKVKPRPKQITADTIAYFLEKDPSIKEKLTPRQREKLLSAYKGLDRKGVL
ncbi:N-acyl amino acid synthase FeeM domain-containing protein [Desulfothermus okinawensis]